MVEHFPSIKRPLTSDLLQDLLHAAAPLAAPPLPGVHSRARVRCSSGDVGAAAAAAAGEASQAAAAAAARGRGSGPPPGTCRRPVGFHDCILGLEPGVVSAPRLPGWRRRGANPSPETQVLVPDVFHLDALAGRQPGRAALRPDAGRTHGPVVWASYPSIWRPPVT